MAVGSADLALTKADDGSWAGNASHLTYVLTVTNAGPYPAADVVVVDALPTGMDIISAPPGATLNGNRVEMNLGTLASYNATSVELTVHLTNTAFATHVTNQAWVSAGTYDAALAGNTSTVVTLLDHDHDGAQTRSRGPRPTATETARRPTWMPTIPASGCRTSLSPTSRRCSPGKPTAGACSGWKPAARRKARGGRTARR